VGGTEQVVTGVSASPYIVTGLTNGASYDFKVAAINAVGASAYSGVVSGTPKASSAKDILSCDFGALGAGTIVGTNITLTAPPNQSVTALAPTFTISPLATLSPASGTARNFTNPQTYTVTAQDGITQVYTVTVQSYNTWTNSASFFILTTPEGANIASGAAETNFPLLLRLNSGNFNFAQAQSDGRDIRFTSLTGTPLSYQIEQWDAAAGTAAVWIKIPSINANARQEVKMYWGKTGVASESSGLNVFNSANGYVSVLHLNETVADSVGTLTPTNINTTVTDSLIGKGRTFVAGNGVNCGDGLTSLPSGNAPHSTGVWFRSNTSGFDIFDWGREDLGKKVQIRLVSPPQIHIDGNFAGVNSDTILSTSQWHYIVNTYSSGTSRIYIDGQLDASDYAGVDITPPSIMRLGGWYNNYGFVGEMDEARLSKVARSANWIKMEFENQKPQQTLVGNLVQSGSTLAVTPTSATLLEGTSTTLSAQAGGAQKIYWIEKRNGVDTVLGTDTFTLPVSAGRATGNQSYIIQFKAIYAASVQTVDVPITITEDLPDPVFTLTGPSNWDGRQTITVTPDISNLPTLQAKGIANMTYKWTVGGVAASKTITTGTPTVPGVMTLTRSQGSGPMTITLVLNNGGSLVTVTKTITVTEPASDPYVARTPGANEIPVTGQFYARNPNTNQGTLYYNGSQSGTPTSVFLKVYTTQTGSDVLYATHTQPLVAGKFAFTAPIAPGLVNYKVVYGTTTGGVDTIVNTVSDLVCGDAYIFEGQSNAWATDSLPTDVTANPWIRTYGHTTATWGRAARNGSDYTVGYFAYDLALSLTTQHNMPICIINGAVGGTRVDEHQANPADHTVAGSSYSIYATLLNRVLGAKLTHGIRGVFWHQGENNSGSAAPTGDYDYKSYQQYFVDMSAAWKQDYPNLGRYIVFQVMPGPCSMGPVGDQLRDVQRTLPLLYSNMDILNTLAIPGYIGCHFTAAGYENVADRTLPVANHRYYGIVPPAPVTAPILKRAYFTSTARTAIALVFDQAVSWNSFSTVNYYVDNVGGKVTSGSASGNVVTLQLNSAAANTATLDYLNDNNWYFGESTSTLLYGANAIPALTFADVAIEPSSQTQTITFGTLAPKTYGNAPFALTATASSGLTVSYMSSDPLVASISGNTVTMLKAGSTTITASQAGNASFNAATPVAQLLTVLAGDVFTWNAAVAGNWSDSTKWTIGSSPSSAGLESYVLNFNSTGTYTSTHNLSAGFLLNKLNFGGSTATLAGNSLSLVVNGSTLPQVNQNSASEVTISTNLALAANTTLGGIGGGGLTLSGIISGGSTLTKTTSGNLTLSGINTYSGGTLVSSGTLTLANKNGFGTGTVTLAAGTTFQQSSFEGNGSGGAVPNALVLSGAGNVVMNMPFSQKDVWLSQPVSGSGGLTVQGGTRSLTLTGSNTFSGGIKLTNFDNRIQISHLNALGTGTFRTEHTTAGSEGKLIPLVNLSTSPGVPNAFDIASGACLNVFADGTNHLLLTGRISSAVGIGNLHKSGTATLTLSGSNTYTGTTTVANGVLACNSATALGQGPVVITSGKLNLNFTGTRQVASLSLGGVAQANGSYGSSVSPATYKNNTYFTGSGTVNVGPAGFFVAGASGNTTVASNLNPATVGDSVTLTATVLGDMPTGNVSFYSGATLLGTRALNASFEAIFTTSSLEAGIHFITATYAGDATNPSSTSPELSQQIVLPGYETWATNGIQELTFGVNDSPTADPDGDGISNLMEFALGGAPMAFSAGILPTFTNLGTASVFEYNRSDAAQSSTTQVVEYGNNLNGWTPVTIPASSAGMVEITPGTPSDRVKVTIPNQGNQTFIRLKVSKQ
jgi:autotransporter-associated beta strand protein